jgi:hypothetical protein
LNIAAQIKEEDDGENEIILFFKLLSKYKADVEDDCVLNQLMYENDN